ncbi:DUF6194 family protein [Amycolatopsis panacis]|uniref:DUF6194 family protein n=1 Tax=Amycolatopsis panacis TaxID=2340917 RepID=UPI0018F5332A|nr:DUF6194 family protein [Amycolatopsis panacis]
MIMEQLLDAIRNFDGVLELAPTEGSAVPEIAWGDHFFYFAPDGKIPDRVQPYATIVTKDYPGDTQSNLDPAGRWRVNIHVGKAKATELTGEDRRHAAPRDFSASDLILPHPVYGALGWIAVVNPAPGRHPPSSHCCVKRTSERNSGLLVARQLMRPATKQEQTGDARETRWLHKDVTCEVLRKATSSACPAAGSSRYRTRRLPDRGRDTSQQACRAGTGLPHTGRTW